MKPVLILLSLLFASVAFAENPNQVSGTIDYVYCDQVDRAILPEACVVYMINAEDEKVGLLFETYEWAYLHAPDFYVGSFAGRKATAFFCDPITGENMQELEVLYVLGRIDDAKTYHYCYAENFELL